VNVIITVICDVMACGLVYTYGIMEGKCVRNKEKIVFFINPALVHGKMFVSAILFQLSRGSNFIGYRNYYHEHFLTSFMSFNDHLIVSAFKQS